MREDEEVQRRIRRNEGRLLERDGFLADPSLPTAIEVQRVIGEMPEILYNGRITNMSCHDLCASPNPRPEVKMLLGLGFNFCLQTPFPKMNIPKMMTRLRNDIRRTYFFANTPPMEEIDADGRYIRELYIKSEWEPPIANDEVEERMDNFEASLVNKDKKYRRYTGHNLTLAQRRICNNIREDVNYRAWPSDKNLGPVFSETVLYTERTVTDHLGDERTYRRLTENAARNRMTKLGYDYRSFVMKYSEVLSEAEITFLWRSLRKCDKKLSRFYLTAKIHKTPWATRPVVSTCGTTLAGLSKWADYWLQKLRDNVPTYIQDSAHLIRLLQELGQLPPGAKIFIADAVGMYTHIDTRHGLEKVSDWIDDFPDELPSDFPVKAVKAALALVMKNNIFECGDSFFEQLLGCAMGTPVACIYATLYYAYHERTVLLPKYSDNLLFLRRFIDDMIGIWVPNGDPTAWDDFKRDLPFGILEWDVIEPSKSVNFLDLTISINANRYIETRTYQKAMNLYLYLPPTSAHPPSVIRGMIYGLLRKYKQQNTHRADYIEMTVLLYQRLAERGWDSSLLARLFDDASAKVEKNGPSKSQQRKEVAANDGRPNRIFIHTEFHPGGIPRKEIRRAFEETCGEAFRNLATESGNRMQIKQTTIAYSRPKNLRDMLTSAKLTEVEGRGVSTFLPA